MRYAVGIYGGSFNPPHLGHVRCLLQGANLCEEFYIILSVGHNRGEIDYRLRYRWLYQLTAHLAHVRILLLEDDAPSKAAYTAEYWQKDADKVKAMIGKPIDAVFCGSDYGADSFWHQCYPQSQIITFMRDDISSSKIRSAPYRYWHWLPEVVKPYYVKKVLLMGGESTGKSTLTINLARHFNTNFIDEAGRDISLHSGDDRLMLSSDFTEILLQHKLNELHAIAQSNKVLFIDTDALVTQFYLNFLDDAAKQENTALSDAIDSLNAYDLILFLQPDVTFVQDGSRSERIAQEREYYSEQIKTLLRNHGKDFIVISGSYQERYLQAVALVEALLQS